MAEFNEITCVKVVGVTPTLDRMKVLLDGIIKKFHVEGCVCLGNKGGMSIHVWTWDNDRPEPTAKAIKEFLGRMWNVSLTGYTMVLHKGNC